MLNEICTIAVLMLYNCMYLTCNISCNLPAQLYNLLHILAMASQAMVDEAKAFLKQESPDSKLNIYDHFCSILHSVLEGRTQNSVDTFEDISHDVKTVPEFDRELGEDEVAMAKIQSLLFEKTNVEEVDPEEVDPEMPLPDLMDISYYFEQAGIGLGREETFRLLKMLTY